jgi:hypothetical protein
MMSVEQSVEWLTGETEVLEENLSQFRFVLHIYQIEPNRGPPQWEASD